MVKYYLWPILDHNSYFIIASLILDCKIQLCCVTEIMNLKYLNNYIILVVYSFYNTTYKSEKTITNQSTNYKIIVKKDQIIIIDDIKNLILILITSGPCPYHDSFFNCDNK